MNRPDAVVVRFGDYSWPTKVWYSYDSSKDPLDGGTLYTEPFVPNHSGELYYRAKFLWVKSDRESIYVKAYKDILDEAGISEGAMDSVPVAEFMPVSIEDTEDESNEDHIPYPNPGPENSVISQDYMPDEDNPPGEIKWGGGETLQKVDKAEKAIQLKI